MLEQGSVCEWGLACWDIVFQLWKSIHAPEIGHLIRKDIARYKRADMKYHSCEVHFLLLLHQFSRKHGVHEAIPVPAIYYCSSKIFRRFAWDFSKIMLCAPSLPIIQNLEVQTMRLWRVSCVPVSFFSGSQLTQWQFCMALPRKQDHYFLLFLLLRRF